MSDLSEKRDENGWIKGSTVGCYTTVIAHSDSSGTYLLWLTGQLGGREVPLRTLDMSSSQWHNTLSTCMIFPFLFFDKGAQEDLPAVEIITELTMKKHFWWTVLSLCPLPCKICFPHSHFPTSFILFVFPCRYIWDFKTQILKHLHENTSCTLCADILNTCRLYITNANIFKATLFQIM